MTTKVKGTKKVISNIKKLEASVLDRLHNAVEKAALGVEREAKILAPIDTSRLQRSITAEESTNPLEYTVGTNVEYAGFQEFGTRKMAAHPYLQPAAEKVSKEYPGIVSVEVKRAVEEVTK